MLEMMWWPWVWVGRNEKRGALVYHHYVCGDPVFVCPHRFNLRSVRSEVRDMDTHTPT